MSSIKTIDEVMNYYNVIDDIKLKITEQLLDVETEYSKFLKDNENIYEYANGEHIITLNFNTYKRYIIHNFLKENNDKLFIKDTDYERDTLLTIQTTNKYDDIIFKYYESYAEQLLYYGDLDTKYEYFNRYNEYPVVDDEDDDDEEEEEEEEDEYDVDHPICVKMRELIIKYQFEEQV